MAAGFFVYIFTDRRKLCERRQKIRSYKLL
nr:MAG TPA: hypothetical protein [Caudoviricetes sp.]